MAESVPNIRRVLVLGILAAIIFATQTSISNALPNDYDFQVAAKKSGTWRGIEVDVSLYDPGLQPNSAQFVAVPVALTTYSAGSSSYFIELGPIKSCYGGQDCQLHPYYSRTVGGSNQFDIDTTRYLASGGQYGYKVDRTGATEFQAIFCSGAGCGVILTQDMQRGDFPYLFTAAETTNGARWWPPVRISLAKGTDLSAIPSYWCYDSINTTHPDGVVTPCVNYSWEFRGGYQVFIPSVMK